MSISSSILAQFEVLNPRATALLSLVDSSGLIHCTTANGEENLLDRRQSPTQYLHAQSGAFKEAVEWVSNHRVEKVDFLIVFGIGLGYPWKALLPWLQADKKRRVVFLEDDLAVVQAFLQSPCAQPFFNDPQSTLLFLEEGDEAKQVKEIVTWYAYERPWSCVASPAYARYRGKVVEALFQELTVLQADVTAVLSEYFDFATSPLRNFGRNIFLWQRSLNAASLFNAFRGCPAIVVAAGPSLEAEIEHLKGLDSKALIFSGGSSVNALLQSGIMPHMATSVDPNPMQYVRLRQAQPFCIPLLYRSRALYEALMYQPGPLLYLRGGDGYPLVEWFEKSFGIHGEVLDGGHSVSNMIIDTAHSFGCRPIIMVGYDLAYTKDARYAGLLSESMAEGESAAFKGESRGKLVDHVTYDGKKIVTEAKWMTEALWIEQFQQRHPRLHLINTAQDGLAIGGVERMSLQEALKKYCSTDVDIESRLHVALQAAASTATSPENFSNTIHKLSKSFEETLEILKTMQSLLVQVSTTQEESPQLLEAGVELEKQLAFRVGLSMLFMMHTKLAKIRKCIDCRPLLDEARQGAYDRLALEDRIRFLIQNARQHLSFLYTMVAWGCLNEHVLPNAGKITPLQGTEVYLQRP